MIDTFHVASSRNCKNMNMKKEKHLQSMHVFVENEQVYINQNTCTLTTKTAHTKTNPWTPIELEWLL